MMADGLTKALPTGVWESFIEQMNLRDVRELIAGRRKGDLEGPKDNSAEEDEWE
jgi:hypothetical protein